MLLQELGRCSRLVKLQASFNRMTSLPEQLASLPRLELMRVAVNCLTHVLFSFFFEMPDVWCSVTSQASWYREPWSAPCSRHAYRFVWQVVFSLQDAVVVATGAQGTGMLPKLGVDVTWWQRCLCGCAAASQPDQDDCHELTGNGKAARRRSIW